MTVIVDGRQGIFLALPLRERDGAARDAKVVVERLNKSAVPTTTTTYHMLKLNSTKTAAGATRHPSAPPTRCAPKHTRRTTYLETRAALTLTEITAVIQFEYGPYKYNNNDNGWQDRRHSYNRALASALDPMKGIMRPEPLSVEPALQNLTCES